MPTPPTPPTSWLAAPGAGLPVFLRTSCVPDELEVAFDGCTLTRSGVTLTGDSLTIRFEMRGPAASVQFPENHVVVIPEGGGEKLDSRVGWGGYADDGSSTSSGSCAAEVLRRSGWSTSTTRTLSSRRSGCPRPGASRRAPLPEPPA